MVRRNLSSILFSGGLCLASVLPTVLLGQNEIRKAQCYLGRMGELTPQPYSPRKTTYRQILEAAYTDNTDTIIAKAIAYRVANPTEILPGDIDPARYKTPIEYSFDASNAGSADDMGVHLNPIIPPSLQTMMFRHEGTHVVDIPTILKGVDNPDEQFKKTKAHSIILWDSYIPYMERVDTEARSPTRIEALEAGMKHLMYFLEPMEVTPRVSELKALAYVISDGKIQGDTFAGGVRVLRYFGIAIDKEILGKITPPGQQTQTLQAYEQEPLAPNVIAALKKDFPALNDIHRIFHGMGTDDKPTILDETSRFPKIEIPNPTKLKPLYEEMLRRYLTQFPRVVNNTHQNGSIGSLT